LPAVHVRASHGTRNPGGRRTAAPPPRARAPSRPRRRAPPAAARPAPAKRRREPPPRTPRGARERRQAPLHGPARARPRARALDRDLGRELTVVAPVAIAAGAITRRRPRSAALLAPLALLAVLLVFVIGVFGAIFGLQPLQASYGPSATAR